MGNMQILEALSDKVYGHDKAKKILINVVNRSKKRAAGIRNKDMALVSLSNCLLIGASGTGKTYLIENLAEIMDFPYIKIDATELTHTSAEGMTKAKMIEKIRNESMKHYKANPDRYKSPSDCTNQMIVFVDEVDKLVNYGRTSGQNWNLGTQAAFLTVFENKSELENITYIFAGAFSDMERPDKIKVNPLGFAVREQANTTEDSDLSSAIIKHGLMPELVGRMGIIVELDDLKEDDYHKILTNTLIPNKKIELELFQISELRIEDDAISTMAAQAYKSGMGVRYLHQTLNNLSIEHEFANVSVETYVSKPIINYDHEFKYDIYEWVIDSYGEKTAEHRLQLFRNTMINYPLMGQLFLNITNKSTKKSAQVWADTSERNIAMVEAGLLNSMEIGDKL